MAKEPTDDNSPGHLDLQDFYGVSRFNNFLFGNIHRCAKTFCIDKTNIPVFPELQEVADISHVSCQVEWHLAQEKDKITGLSREQ